MTNEFAPRRGGKQPRALGDAPFREAKPLDPVAQAMTMLNSRHQKSALLKAVEQRVKTDAEQRRRFAAAAGRVYGYTGEQALVQAVRNYLQDLSRSSEDDRTSTLVWLAETVASISGGRADRPIADPRAAAEALFRPRDQEPVAAPA